MIRVITTAFMAAAVSLAGAARAQDTQSIGQEPPSATAGVRIITLSPGRTGASLPADASQATSLAPPVASPAGARSSLPADRYRFDRVGDGFLRIDNRNGQVALCTQQGTGWDCRSALEHPTGLDKEIAGLRADVDHLKELQKEIGGLRQLPKEMEGLKPLPRQVADLQQSKIMTLKLLQSEAADVKHLRTEVENLKSLRNEVEGLKQSRGEIDNVKDLRLAIDDLKKQVAALQAQPASRAIPGNGDPPRPPETVPPTGNGKSSSQLSPRRSIDRAAAFISDAWQRVLDMISNFQKEAMRRS